MNAVPGDYAPNIHALVTACDPQGTYVVTEVGHYKRSPSWLALDFEQEYVTLTAVPHPLSDVSRPTLILKVSRTIGVDEHALLARLGIWGNAFDTVTSPGEKDHLDEQPNYLAWSSNEAPRLMAVSSIIYCIQFEIPSYHLKKSFRMVARAIIETIHHVFNGSTQVTQNQCLTQRHRFLGVIPICESRAQNIAKTNAIIYELFARYNSILH